MSVNTTFIQSTKTILDTLSPDKAPIFGRMSAQHMVEHLVLLFKVSRNRIKAPLVIAEEQVEPRKAWLMTDKPIREGAKMPGTTDEQPLPPLRFDDMQAAIAVYEQEVTAFYQYYKEEPTSTAIHPLFGPLSLIEWEQFHCKHMTHHFKQFELL